MTPVMRYFLARNDVYEQIRQTVDAAWGLPANGQVTALPPQSNCPVIAGMVYLSARADHCAYEPIVTLLPQLLRSGAVHEIDEAAYLQAAASIPLPFGLQAATDSALPPVEVVPIADAVTLMPKPQEP